jgi:hypothetical protein
VYGGVVGGFQRYHVNSGVSIATSLAVALVNVAVLTAGYGLVPMVVATTAVRVVSYFVYRLNAHRIFPALRIQFSLFRRERLMIAITAQAAPLPPQERVELGETSAGSEAAELEGGGVGGDGSRCSRGKDQRDHQRGHQRPKGHGVGASRTADTEAPAGEAGASVKFGSASDREKARSAGDSDLADVGSLETLRPLDDLELHVVALGQRAEAFGDDCGVMNEDVLATILRDETEPLCVIEPLDRALRHCCNLLTGEPAGSGETPGPRGRVQKPQEKSRPDSSVRRQTVSQVRKGETNLRMV